VNNGEFVFDGDFGPVPEKGLEWPPFRTFGREYYTYQLLLDLKIGKEWAVRTEPHPRFYTDTTNTVLVAVPALPRTEWWPMISFVDFKSPAVGGTHIFRPGEPMLQILIVPVTYAGAHGRRGGRGARDAGADSRQPPHTGGVSI
jgi:hypothetical protein